MKYLLCWDRLGNIANTKLENKNREEGSEASKASYVVRADYLADALSGPT